MAAMRLANIELRPNRRYLLLVALIAVTIYVLVPQLGDFQSSRHLLRQLSPAWTGAAVVLTALTYLAGAATYFLLAFKPLKYGRTVLVQLAAMFINRLLPGGLGSAGVNYVYLRRARHNAAQAAGVVAVNNLIGLLGNGLLVAAALAVSGSQVKSVAWNSHYAGLLAKSAVVIAVLLGVLAVALGRRKFVVKMADARRQLLSYRRRPWRLPAALASSMLLTSCNALCLLCCALALGVHLPFVVGLLVLSLGVGAGAAVPTPGGLGGFEAGLVAGFITYHVASPAALAAALFYRLVSYWLPLLAGVPAFLVCQRRKWF